MLNNLSAIEQLLDSPEMRAHMAEQPTPFSPISVEAAERRLRQCRQLLGAFADTLKTHMETNPISDFQAYMGEDPINITLIEMTSSMKSLLTGALLQVRVAAAGDEIVTALDGFEFMQANVDECINLAHQEVCDRVEEGIGSLDALREETEKLLRVRVAAAGTRPVEA